jgi:hypothetical protein
MRPLVLVLILLLVSPAAGQYAPPPESGDMRAMMPPVPPLTMFEEVLALRAQVESRVAAVLPQAARADAVIGLVSSLIQDWDTYGEYMDREHGDFPNMARGRPYWLLTTDEAADTLTDRLAAVVEAYVKANPEEKLGLVRAEWEQAIQGIGVPRSRLYGFQVVDLARKALTILKDLESKHPGETATLQDAYVRFLWDLTELYQQIHATWFDRHALRVSQEDWIIHRLKGRCENPMWQNHLSFTAIGVDTANMDPMNYKFMHRIVLVDPACPETVDFVVPLPHYRKMEKELGTRTAEERQQMLERYQREAEERGSRQPGGAR